MVNILSGIAKAAGFAGLAAVTYDAHKLAKVRAGENRREKIAASGLDAYMDSKQLDKPSVLLSKAQDKRFDLEMKGKLFNNIRNGINSAVGYVKGFAESIVSNVVPFALSAVSILTKGSVSKVSSALLAGYEAVSIAKNVFGIGKKHMLK